MDPRSAISAGTALADRPSSMGSASVPAARRSGSRPVPERSQEFAHLTLEALREYRKTLNAEEAQVSYWRRIIQARLDVVRAGGLSSTDGAALRPLLSDARIASSRNSLVDIMPVADIPPLPSLAELWDRRIEPEDSQGLTLLEDDLDAAERQLSAYRKALHQRIDDATGELIARYREAPTLCLSVLPLRPERRTTS